MNKFSCVLMNPPYNGGKHLYMRFLNKTVNISEIALTINPINFIFSKTNKGIHKQLKDTINNHNVEIEEIDGNKIFDASFLGFTLGICKFSQKTSEKNVLIHYLNNEEMKYNSKNNITRVDLSNEIIKSIINKIDNKNYSKIWDIFNFMPNYTGFGNRNKIKEFDKNQLFVFLPIKAIDNKNYVFFSNKKSIRNEVLTAEQNPTSGGIAVNSKKEGENIIKYLKSDIVRFILYLCLNGLEGGFSGFKIIPIINFNDNLFNNNLSVVNNNLYSIFNLNNIEIKYIQNILPDYYGIRNK